MDTGPRTASSTTRQTGLFTHCYREWFFLLRWARKIRFVYFRNRCGLHKIEGLGDTGQSVFVCVCFTMVLVHCVPFQCIWSGADPDQENQEVRFEMIWLTNRLKTTISKWVTFCQYLTVKFTILADCMITFNCGIFVQLMLHFLVWI